MKGLERAWRDCVAATAKGLIIEGAAAPLFERYSRLVKWNTLTHKGTAPRL